MGLNLKIGTRSSPLALWQAEWVKSELLKIGGVATVELVKIKTSGDKILDVPLAKVGGKGLFTKEIEEALLRREVDLAVHSMKDVPTMMAEGLETVVIPRRENPHDVLVSKNVAFDRLPQKARIGTSSLRRRAQLKRIRPDLDVIDIRGNVQSRIAKIETLKLDGVILAAAGMIRLGFKDEITEFLSPAVCLPSVGQGALAIETRINDPRVQEVAWKLHHQPTADCVETERAFLRRLEGGCQVPIAGHCTLAGETLTLEGLVCDIDGKRYHRATMTGTVAQGREIGIRLAEQLLTAGGDAILAELYSSDRD